ncbi:MAG: class I SAM-dependent methyltransferase [Bacteroidota bacterium]
MIRYYFNYQFRAITRHGVHSPFVYDLIETVFRDRREFDCYEELSEIRKRLKADKTLIGITDLGAGSKRPASKKTVSEILLMSVQRKSYQRLLFRLVNRYQPKLVIELGTSLGLTTSYILAGMPKDGQLYTFEGDPQILDYAMKNVIPADKRVHAVQGNFDDTLPEFLQSGKKIDLAYIDGNHTYEATLRYFEWLQPHLSETGCIVFDDIYWSKDMMKAWEKIIEHPASQTSVDIFKLGMVFTAPAKVKQHFMVKF